MKVEKIAVSSESQEKEKYDTPDLCVYGALEDLTQMPGGSLQTEGNSGKPHKKCRPNRPCP